MHDKKAREIQGAIQNLRPNWIVLVEYQGCVSIDQTGLAESCWFGDANETYGASLYGPDGEDMGYLETWLSNEAPAQALAEGVVKAVEAAQNKKALGVTSAPSDTALSTRMARAAEAGELAFWEKVADAFPEARAGDLDPMLAMQLSQVLLHGVQAWVATNTEHEMFA